MLFDVLLVYSKRQNTSSSTFFLFELYFIKFLIDKKVWFDKYWWSKPTFEAVVKEGWPAVKNVAAPTLEKRLANCRTHISR